MWSRQTKTAKFSRVTLEQANFIKPVDMEFLSMIPEGDPDLTAYLNELHKTKKSEQHSNTFWVLTPENPGESEDHTPIQTRVLKEMYKMKEKEKLNPKDDTESPKKVLERFDWTSTLLKENKKPANEVLLVDCDDIFATHSMDIGMNKRFNVKLTPKDEEAVYSQRLHMPIHLKEDLFVDMALIHKNGITTVMLFSKYARPIFTERKPIGKLRLLVDFRISSTLIADNYINFNHPVSTLSDAAQHMAGISLLWQLDCSQAYHCLQMEDQRSVENLVLNFPRRTFAYKRLTQGLSRFVSAFSSLIREYLDSVVKTEQCAQYVDDIGIAAYNATDIIRNLWAVF